MEANKNIKPDIHQLIDATNNLELLETIYAMLKSRKEYPDGSLIKFLTVKESEELNLSYKESFDDKNLIDLEEFKGNTKL